MPVTIDLDKRGMPGHPSEYGLKDWHHNAEGKVDYPWYKSEKYKTTVNEESPWYNDVIPLEDQKWHEDCSETQYDNLSYGRNYHAAICEGFDEWERNERLYN